MTGRIMSDAEIKRRKRTQGHISQATGALGLAALGGTVAASRGGRNTLRKIPALKSKIKPPPPKDPDIEDRIKNAVTPVLATSAGLGGAGAFNFASYTNAESRKKKPVVKSMGIEMGYYGEEGRQGVVEKAWTPNASTFDSERGRQKRAKGYEAGLGAAAAGAGAGAGVAGTKAAKAERKYRGAKPRARNLPNIKAGHLKAVKGGKVAAGLAGASAVTGGAAALVHRGRKKTWQPYAG
jgi:hypothetical protein